MKPAETQRLQSDHLFRRKMRMGTEDTKALEWPTVICASNDDENIRIYFEIDSAAFPMTTPARTRVQARSIRNRTQLSYDNHNQLLQRDVHSQEGRV